MNAHVQFSRSVGSPRRLKLAIDQYYAVCEAGLFQADERTELIDGQIYIMNALHLPHARIAGQIEFALRSAISGRTEIEAIGGVTVELQPNNAPIPDVSVIRRVDAEKGVPDGNLLLAIEVADSTERRDMGLKRRLYARHGVPEYWVALVRKRRIVRFSEPEAGDYKRRDDFVFGDCVPSCTIAGVSLPAGSLQS
jgi:Uma2 family endonuclease